jgi:hypothetical protein
VGLHRTEQELKQVPISGVDRVDLVNISGDFGQRGLISVDDGRWKKSSFLGGSDVGQREQGHSGG